MRCSPIKWLQEVRNRHVERRAESNDYVQAGGLLTSFEMPDVVAVQARELGQLFLRDAALRSQLSKPLAKDLFGSLFRA
jgi:hypothetical protein